MGFPSADTQEVVVLTRVSQSTVVRLYQLENATVQTLKQDKLVCVPRKEVKNMHILCCYWWLPNEEILFY